MRKTKLKVHISSLDNAIFLKLLLATDLYNFKPGIIKMNFTIQYLLFNESCV